MTEPGFPPLPHPTRITVHRADLRPDPTLEVHVDAALPAPWGAVWLFVGGAFGLSLALFPLGMVGLGAAVRGDWGEAAAGMACSSIFAVWAATVWWRLWKRTERCGLWVTAEGIAVDRVRFRRARSEEVPFEPTEESAGDRPVLFDPSPDRFPGGEGPLHRRTADGNAACIPPLTGPDRAWLIAALARVVAALGRPGLRPAAPALVAVRPGDRPPPSHPAVRAPIDRPGRLVLTFPGWFGSGRKRAGRLLPGTAFLLIGFVAAALFGPPWEAEDWLTALLFVGGPLAAGAATIGEPFFTVRVTVGRGRWGRPRVRRSAGVGPVRWRWTVRADDLSAVALGFDAAGDPTGAADPPRTRAWLVRRPIEAAAAEWLNSTWLTPLVAAAPADDGGRLAAAVAGRVAAKLGELGWNPAPPVDWRFGWADPHREPRDP